MKSEVRLAADILRVSALLGLEAIPFELIGAGGGEISTPVEAAAKGNGFVESVPSVAPEIAADLRQGH